MAINSSKRFLLLGILFSTFAILFAILYYFKLISTMDLYLAVTYITYFVGLALMYNGAYTREHNKTKSTAINFLVGGLFFIGSVIMLIYGFSTGVILFF